MSASGASAAVGHCGDLVDGGVGVSRIALIGFMGSGKSTIGPMVAGALGMRFVDTDALVIQAAGGRSVPAVFAEEGETSFRDRESQAVAHACASTYPVVIATGGGAVLRDENVRLLRGAATVVWLTVRPDVIVRRVGGGDRPLLADPNGAGATPAAVLTRVLTLLAQRGPLYHAAAHVIVDASDGGPDTVARHIVRKVSSLRTDDSPLETLA